MKIRMMALGALAMMCGVTAWAGGLGKPIVAESVREWTSDFDYICANEPMHIVAHRTIRTHEFQTSTGTYHYLESASITSLAEGVNTGRKWVAEIHRTIRDVFKSGTGETIGFTVREVYRPLEGDGPMFAIDNQYVVRLDADGNLIMENETGLDCKFLGSAK